MILPAIGFALRKRNNHLLHSDCVDAVEFTLEHATHPLRRGPLLKHSRRPRHVSMHCLLASPGSLGSPDRRYLAQMRAIAEENGADSVSDHLGFSHDSRGRELGHFVAPPFTEIALDVVRQNVERIQRSLGKLPFFLENIAHQILWKSTMSEAQLLRRVLRDTGCGWLLDVTNAHANERNYPSCNARDFIHEVMPSAQRVLIHLSGGFFDRQSQRYIDSHSQAVPKEVWSLYEEAIRLGGGKVEAVFLERDDNLPGDDEWQQELLRARRLAEQALLSGTPNPGQVHV